ncbi:MAG: PEFG-CTERM sorting domain-containing protein [Cenarchaeum sp. SB0665_bin_23]|nr:PEFG-CTERM sorting domain-containing protein [Cenarchaeum sp. SB0667_bin_13]MXY61778.1 PEFG-CTERM sorting domain-containing protein [Cenarchaeum sp. SB0665_bin_23]MXZ93586.1 PEFG-CTERM sorting domain-containing protein [Cenarchaeum sp. SB0666_bin_15]MYB46256.1 PEFG-CTERM sorting domain-containing protein [Cenarchaeum sp. SB0662_bin_33]MYC79343.1 PEFG-CTERM sorting domain-containing protein [Cenarchaeum sp. SB0661_bin_35]MYD58476.1 PEFG-CTERM sorting domain-containing protein [Cenarchaeum sp
MMNRSVYCAAATIAILMMGVYALPANASFLPSEGMELVASADDGSTIVHVTGKTIRDDPIILRYISPTNNLVKLDQIDPDSDGMFATTFNVAALDEDGLYRIIASQGEASMYKLEVNVPVSDGMTPDLLAIESNFERPTMLVGPELFEGGMIVLIADAMEGSDVISISGQTDITNMPIIIRVLAPNGNVVMTDQIFMDAHGLFDGEIQIGGPLWSQDGEYTVVAEQDMEGYSTSVVVDIADGLVVPEFGTITALILAVSIISVVVISARSRLSIVPKF